MKLFLNLHWTTVPQFVILVGLCLWSGRGKVVAQGLELAGSVSIESRLYHDKALLPGQSSVKNQPSLPGRATHYPSAALEPKCSFKWESTGADFELQPYLRFDRYDSNRTMLDLRSAKAGLAMGSWYLKAGVDVTFWGVLEFQNLVDILNQTDLPYDFLSKRKLGQPMINISLITDWGNLDAYVLEYFRPKTFPGPAGRSRPPFPVSHSPVYESQLGERQPDFAFRFSRTLGAFEIAASHFFGTSRDPEITAVPDPASGVLLSTRYPLLNQSGLEVQWTLDNLILKTEDVLRLKRDFTWQSAATGLGMEYNVGALLGRTWDFSVLGEYLYDRRNEFLLTPFTRDVFVGLRVGCNDSRSTEVTLGLDWDHRRGRLEILMGELGTRLTDRLKIWISGRYLTKLEKASPFYPLRNDGYTKLQFELFL